MKTQSHSCCWIVAAKRLRHQVRATPDSKPQKHACVPNLPENLEREWQEACQESPSQKSSRRNAYVVLGLAKVTPKTFYD
eukprot:1523930-Amphidinium_carterae.2